MHAVVGSTVAPKYIIHRILTSGTYKCDFIWKKGLCECNYIKNLVMRPFWIIEMGPKYNDKCSIRYAQVEETHTKGEKAM